MAKKDETAGEREPRETQAERELSEAGVEERNDFGRVDPALETHSSGDARDLLHDEEDRLAADPALEPELAQERDLALAEEAAERNKAREAERVEQAEAEGKDKPSKAGSAGKSADAPKSKK